MDFDHEAASNSTNGTHINGRDYFAENLVVTHRGCYEPGYACHDYWWLLVSASILVVLLPYSCSIPIVKRFDTYSVKPDALASLTDKCVIASSLVFMGMIFGCLHMLYGSLAIDFDGFHLDIATFNSVTSSKSMWHENIIDVALIITTKSIVMPWVRAIFPALYHFFNFPNKHKWAAIITYVGKFMFFDLIFLILIIDSMKFTIPFDEDFISFQETLFGGLYLFILLVIFKYVFHEYITHHPDPEKINNSRMSTFRFCLIFFCCTVALILYLLFYDDELLHIDRAIHLVWDEFHNESTTFNLQNFGSARKGEPIARQLVATFLHFFLYIIPFILIITNFVWLFLRYFDYSNHLLQWTSWFAWICFTNHGLDPLCVAILVFYKHNEEFVDHINDQQFFKQYGTIEMQYQLGTGFYPLFAMSGLQNLIFFLLSQRNNSYFILSDSVVGKKVDLEDVGAARSERASMETTINEAELHPLTP